MWLLITFNQLATFCLTNKWCNRIKYKVGYKLASSYKPLVWILCSNLRNLRTALICTVILTPQVYSDSIGKLTFCYADLRAFICLQCRAPEKKAPTLRLRNCTKEKGSGNQQTLWLIIANGNNYVCENTLYSPTQQIQTRNSLSQYEEVRH